MNWDLALEHSPPLECAQRLAAERYPQARAVFLAGSVVRGEHTSTSDLDLVVVYEQLANAYRESYRSHGWPIEAFVHDPGTLRYFFAADGEAGIASLASMIAEGIQIPGSSEFGEALKTMARTTLAAGPPKWDAARLCTSRYCITDLADDLRAPRSPAECRAALARLYEMLANHHLRARGLWSARGKSIPRRLAQVDAELALRFCAAFDTAFTMADAMQVLALCEEVLLPDGGFLFEGYRAEAPGQWRMEP